MSPAVTVVTGPIGAGKTTLAAALAAGFDRSVHLEADWFWRWIRRGFVAPWLRESHEQNVALIGIVDTTALDLPQTLALVRERLAAGTHDL